MGFLCPLNISVEEKHTDLTETETSVLVICNFRVSSTPKVTLYKAEQGCTVVASWWFPYKMCLIYMKKDGVCFPTWQPGRGSLDSEKQEA